ncbi:MAG: alkane 1-monooxygenase [Gammaproteobacteria bacterium]|jgi:luciferase family oxidoreductase group 1|nr:alkane 1-monooxygenase [Gammaproteobacteria bacterium]
MTHFSILDLSPITEGNTPATALANSLDLIQHAEKWGYERYWVAEHHNMKGIASAATAVVIGHLAGGTATIRVGAGGIMLPNHAPLVIAEQFGTLASLFPGRIDLGLGRAPGTDQITAHALRRSLSGNVDDFPRDVVELQHYFKEQEPGQRVTAVPGAGTNIPLYILGSSLFGAQLSGMLGLPFAFASHFAPAMLNQAIEVYREHFKPSDQLQEPYLMLGFNVCAADTTEEADYLRSSSMLSLLSMRTGAPRQLPPPVANLRDNLSKEELHILNNTPRCAAFGNIDEIREGMSAFIKEHNANELILVSSVFDHNARLRSYEITMDAAQGID